ncbi:MAG: RagB/SusD family nutrient uptake outer membrane protein [Muribaculaceae bacterium]|nr:RagB/SusD family nutrient uptake outer membrane protein [Muribaculaceae bacterium]
MKLKNIFVSSLLALSLGTGFSSCDYLDVVPPEQPSIDNTMDNYKQALGFLYGCYIGVSRPMFGGWTANVSIDHGQPVPSMTLGDLHTTTDEWIMDDIQFNQAPIVRAAYSNTLSANNNVNDYKCYSIWLSNVFLFLEKLDQLGVPRGIVDEETAREWRAEAKFLMAYYHFCLLRRYGPIAIVEKRVPMDASTSSFPGRMHYDYCVKWICDRLDEAAEELPAKRPASETGRATSTICKALKSRILLYAASPLFNGKFPYPEWKNKVETPGYGYELISNTYDREKWVKAKKAAEEALTFAINEGERELYYGNEGNETQQMLDKMFVPVDGADEDFKRAVLRMRNVVRVKEPDGNREFIWSCGDSYGSAGGVYNQRIARNPIPKTSMAPNGLNTTYSCIGATLATVMRFGTKDGYQPENDPNFSPEADWYKSAGYKDNSFAKRSHIINLNKNREPRYYAWISFDGGDYGTLLRYGAEPVPVDLLRSDKQGYSQLAMRDYCPTGFLVQKWIDTKATISNMAVTNWIYSPLPLIRLAELYLNLAECCAELDDVNGALENVNIIRRRAGAKELTAEMVSSSGKSIVEWVRDERSIEFFDEMQRYFDVRRWCKGDLLGFGTRRGLNAHVQNPSFRKFNTPGVVNQGHVYSWGDRMYLYPIDANELYSNPQFVQSPGY